MYYLTKQQKRKKTNKRKSHLLTPKRITDGLKIPVKKWNHESVLGENQG